MKVEMKFGPAATIAQIGLSAGETIVAESGAFMAMRGNVAMETTTRQKNGGGGIIKGLKRMLSGESFFLNHFKAQSASEVWLGTALPGDIMEKELNGEKLIISSGNFLACEPDIHIDLEWQGFKSVFSGEGIFWIKAKGTGKILLSSFGFIYPIDVDGDYIVDTGHIVAFEETLNFNISKASATWLDAFLSGEGFVCRFTGKGRVWCQSHNPNEYGRELTPFLRPKRD